MSMHPLLASKYSFATLGAILGLLVSSSTAFAKPTKHQPPTRAVPEINATHAGAALALVIGGAAVVLGRRRKVG